MLYHQGLFFVLEILQIKFINKHHNDLLVSHFNIQKIYELIAQKH